MFKVVSPMVVVLLSVVASTTASAHTLPAGPPQCRAINMTATGWFQLVKAVELSSLTDPIADGRA